MLHSDGRCLFVDPNNSEHVVIKVNLTAPLTYSTDSMFACLWVYFFRYLYITKKSKYVKDYDI